MKKESKVAKEEKDKIEKEYTGRFSKSNLSLECPLRKAGQMTIGKTHPRLRVTFRAKTNREIERDGWTSSSD